MIYGNHVKVLGTAEGRRPLASKWSVLEVRRGWVSGEGLLSGAGYCQALGSLRYRPQAVSRASSGVPTGMPLGSTASS